MMKILSVSEKGQIAIPQSIRNTLNINKGDTLTIFQINNKLVLEKTEDSEKKMKDEFKDIAKFSELAMKKVWDNKEDEIWNQYIK